VGWVENEKWLDGWREKGRGDHVVPAIPTCLRAGSITENHGQDSPQEGFEGDPIGVLLLDVLRTENHAFLSSVY